VTSNDNREQYDKMIRWFKKLQDINQRKRFVNAPAEQIMDEIAAFIQNCYHLKDWILHDRVARAKLDCLGIDIDSIFISEDDDLGLLTDLCNGVKTHGT
jgi:hypothetical protein